MKQRKTLQPFSARWAWISGFVFVLSQILLGFLLADLAKSTQLSLHTRFLIEAVLNLLSYFVGGLIIGLTSPGLRMREPAIGAVGCVALMFVVGDFTPLSFVEFSVGKFLVGGVLAFSLALIGARLGEVWSGNRLPRTA